jgi:hypothetical protein
VERSPEGVRAVVLFALGYARVRVEAGLQPDGQRNSRTAAREAAFREGDPILERFRAAGLIVAGLAADLAPSGVPAGVGPAPHTSLTPRDAPQVNPTAPPQEILESAPAVAAAPAPPENPTPVSRPHRWPVALSLAGIVTPLSDRPRIGGALDGDFPLPLPSTFITTHASYGQTVQSDAAGISIFDGTLGVGAGVAARIPLSQIWVRSRARVEIEALRVAIDQPGTGHRDAESVLLPGLGADVELVWAMSPVAGVFAGARLDWSNDKVSVLVAGKPTEVLSSWSAVVGLGATVWLP